MLEDYKSKLGVASSGDIDRFFVVEKAVGDLIYDLNNNSYIDCTSQGWTSSIGHSHPRIIKSVSDFVHNQLIHIRPSYYTVPKLELANILVNKAPVNITKVNFCLHGSLAVEGAVKLGLLRFPYKPIAVLDTGFCGRSIFTGSLSWDYEDKREFYQMSNNVVRIPSAYCYRCKFGKKRSSCNFECAEYTNDIFSKNKPGIFIYEPIQGNGGQITFPHQYHKLLRKICTDHNVVMIADEIQTAFGKLKTLFASDFYDINPDIITVGKALGGGYPLAATLYGDDFDFRSGDHTFTFASFPPSMIASIEAINIIKDESICNQAYVKGLLFKELLLTLQEGNIFIGDIRQEGLLIGIEIVKDRSTKEPYPEKVQSIIDFGLKNGVLFGCDKHGGMGTVLKIKPPSVITYDNIYKVVDILEKALNWG